ncbi:MAG: response regulator transcription factor [Flavobacteriales bacterium]|nr:response regulator transcription factor [Flavobacteriales bacterium]
MINVLLVDDYALIRQCIRDLLKKETERINVVGECSNGKEVLPFLETNKVDVILMDCNMPLQNGIETTKQVKQRYPEIKVIGLSMNDDLFTQESFFKNGADGFLSKSKFEIEELISAINEPIISKI